MSFTPNHGINAMDTIDPKPSDIPQHAVATMGQGLAGSGQYLTLRLGQEHYAIDILKVQEIRSYEEPTRMVNAPVFIKGVINLRGVIVPIVDMRMKLGLENIDYNQFTVVVILNVRGTVIGVVVDAVSDVVTLAAESIKPAPQFEAALDGRFIAGLATVEDRMLIVMNMDAMMSNAELGVLVNALA